MVSTRPCLQMTCDSPIWRRMTDKFSQDRSEKLIKFYEAYRAAYDAALFDGKLMRFDWWELPNPIDGTWMAYCQMLGDYATELANIINELTNNVHRLRAWDFVLAGLDDADKYEISYEFITLLGTVALGQPYAIRSRFVFAVGHLSHQANKAKERHDWKDDFPEKNLYLDDIERYASKWGNYPAFKSNLERVGGYEFKQASDDFRNTYNHEFPSRLVLGVTKIVKRDVIEGRVRYSFGGTGPMTVAEVACLLVKERDHCYNAFQAFQSLVEEQIAAIVAVEGGGSTVSGVQVSDPVNSD
jgi:hypothetical protein